VILYEYPFNERIRTYLRLEHLFRRLGELVPAESALSHHYALMTIFEVMDVAARADLKTDILRDLERHKSVFNAYRGNPAISETALDQVVHQIEHNFAAIHALNGRAGQALTENEWLMGVRSRASIPGGRRAVLPGVIGRQVELERWLGALTPLIESVFLLLKLMRDADVPYKVIAPGGQFQQNLPQGRTFQLLRLRIDPRLRAIPEISGNRLIVLVRLMRHGQDDRLHAINDDVPFELTLCA
jgi:cell division protein ZapD